MVNLDIFSLPQNLWKLGKLSSYLRTYHVVFWCESGIIVVKLALLSSLYFVI